MRKLPALHVKSNLSGRLHSFALLMGAGVCLVVTRAPAQENEGEAKTGDEPTVMEKRSVPEAPEDEGATDAAHPSDSSLADLVAADDTVTLMVEPSDIRSEVFVPLPGAKTTGLVAGRWKNGIFHAYSRKDFRALGMEWKEFRAAGLTTAGKHLAAVELVFDRDSRGTVQVVRAVSESPLMATAIFTDAFRKRLEDVLGIPFHVVVPSRSVALAFPSVGGDPSLIIAEAAALYKDVIYPASAEIFEVGKAGVRAVGTFKED